MRRRRCSRWAAGIVLALGGLGLLAVIAVRGVGAWLVVDDPLVRSPVLVVLAGDFPFRALEGARLHREGWAAEIWLQPSHVPAREAALARLGFRTTGEEDNNQRLLERLGVPAGAIRVLEGKAQNTVEEVLGVAAEARRRGVDRVILVTSKAHTRRVRATWRALAGAGPAAVVRYAPEDPFDAAGWWRDTRDALTVSREVLGLLNVWAGFPVRPSRGDAS